MILQTPVGTSPFQQLAHGPGNLGPSQSLEIRADLLDEDQFRLGKCAAAKREAFNNLKPTIASRSTHQTTVVEPSAFVQQKIFNTNSVEKSRSLTDRLTHYISFSLHLYIPPNSSPKTVKHPARTVILTNGTTAHRSGVRSAAAKLDERVVKFDAGTNWHLEQINRPSGKLCVSELVRRISMMPDIVIQSMFVHGPADNARPEHVHTWAEWLKRLAPTSVQIYSLDRQPAKSWVREVPRQELETIAAYLKSTAGVPAHVY